MKILVSGFNEFSKKLLATLKDKNVDVFVLEKNKISEDLVNEFDFFPLEGNLCDYSFLESLKHEFGKFNYYLIFNEDEENIVSALFARRIGLADEIYLLIKELVYKNKLNEIFEDIGNFLIINDILNLKLKKLISNKNIVKTVSFFNNSLELVATVVNNPVVANIPLKDLSIMFDDAKNFRILLIVRNNEVMIPSGDDVLKLGDKIYLFEYSKEIRNFILFLSENIQKEIRDEEIIKRNEQDLDNILIYGKVNNIIDIISDFIGKYNFTVLTKNVYNFQDIPKSLVKMNVIDIRNQKISVLREYLKNVDIFIANDNSDEVNFVASMIAKQCGVKKIISIVKNDYYNDLYEEAGIFSYINIHDIFINRLLNNMKNFSILNLITIERGVEVFEIEITDSSSVVNKKLKDIKLPKGVIVANIVREHSFIVPQGDIVLKEGDHLLILSLKENVNDVKKIFGEKRLKFFGI